VLTRGRVGSSNVDVCAFFGAKNLRFFEIYGIRTVKGEGVEPVRTRGAANFWGFLCGGSFMCSSFRYMPLANENDTFIVQSIHRFQEEFNRNDTAVTGAYRLESLISEH